MPKRKRTTAADPVMSAKTDLQTPGTLGGEVDWCAEAQGLVQKEAVRGCQPKWSTLYIDPFVVDA